MADVITTLAMLYAYGALAMAALYVAPAILRPDAWRIQVQRITEESGWTGWQFIAGVGVAVMFWPVVLIWMVVTSRD